jgi:hypothetical protein
MNLQDKYDISIQKHRLDTICKDGFKISIQASANHYCTPKKSGIDTIYTHVELGFPSERDSLIDTYVEDLSKEDEEIDYTKSVYPWVPAQVVSLLIAKHGGWVNGSLPKLGLIVKHIVRMPIMRG